MGSKCMPDPAMGPKRCVPQGPDAGCRAEGAPCARPDECCAGAHCLPGSGGSLACGSACVSDGDACTTGTDCCGASSGTSDCLRLEGHLVCAAVLH
jgi:hypothetical protein